MGVIFSSLILCGSSALLSEDYAGNVEIEVLSSTSAIVRYAKNDASTTNGHVETDVAREVCRASNPVCICVCCADLRDSSSRSEEVRLESIRRHVRICSSISSGNFNANLYVLAIANGSQCNNGLVN